MVHDEAAAAADDIDDDDDEALLDVHIKGPFNKKCTSIKMSISL